MEAKFSHFLIYFCGYPLMLFILDVGVPKISYVLHCCLFIVWKIVNVQVCCLFLYLEACFLQFIANNPFTCIWQPRLWQSSRIDSEVWAHVLQAVLPQQRQGDWLHQVPLRRRKRVGQAMEEESPPCFNIELLIISE